MSNGHLGERSTRQHASDLTFPRGPGEFTHAGIGNFLNDLFRDAQLLMRLRSNLGEMRDHKHLVSISDCGQGLTYSHRCSTANACINFIENERWG